MAILFTRRAEFVPAIRNGRKNVSTLQLNVMNSDEAAIEEGIKRLAGAIEKMRGR